MARTAHSATGAYAEHALAAIAKVVAIPDELDAVTAVALVHDGLTAVALVDRLPVDACAASGGFSVDDREEVFERLAITVTGIEVPQKGDGAFRDLVGRALTAAAAGRLRLMVG